MPLSTIHSVFYFAKQPQPWISNDGVEHSLDTGSLVDFSTCQTTYSFQPDGVNMYFGFLKEVISRWENGGTMLDMAGHPWSHSTHLEFALDALNNGPDSEKTIVFALQPPGGIKPFDFVIAKRAAVEALAAELQEYRKRANPGKNLRIVVRFASEMNTKENTTWGAGNSSVKAADFILAYKEVRAAFRSVSTEFLFSFSPALRADLSPTEINKYWPGIANVDFLSGTWYWGGTDTLEQARTVLTAYFETYKQRVLNKPGCCFALDEWGGCNGTKHLPPPLKKKSNGEILLKEDHAIGWDFGLNHLDVLIKMRKHLDKLAADDMPLEYATLFLEKKWNPWTSLSPLWASS
ncbi:MAG: hypothetical protein QM758_07475 [Armatimonas sp.]